MPPIHTLTLIQVPGDILFKFVNFFLVHLLEQALFQRLAALSVYLRVNIRNFQFQRFGNFPVQRGFLALGGQGLVRHPLQFAKRHPEVV